MAWKQTGLVGTPYWEEPIGGPTGEKVSEPEQGALESTLELVKKSLWTLERHTQSTSGRLDKNNQSGPSYPLYKISKWGEPAVLDMMLETLVEMQHTLETSSIARHSKSPLEESIDSFKKSSVSFNEKTMRWHDDQTNLMVKKSDPRVAEALIPKPSALATAGAAIGGTMKKAGSGIMDFFGKGKTKLGQAFRTKETKGKMKSDAMLGMGSYTTTPEEKKEAKAEDERDDKEQEDQGDSLKGIWSAMKERAKKSWFAENWKMILAGLIFLFAPLKWIKKLWEFVKVAWDFTKKHPFMVIIGLVAAKIFGLGNILKLGFKTLSKTLVGGFKLMKMAGGGIRDFFRNRKAANFMKAQGLQTRTGPGLLSRTGTKIATGARTAGGAVVSGVKTAGSAIKAGAIRAVEGGKAVAGKAVEGLKSAGGAVKKGAGNIASASKGIFSSIVKKFGTAGKWIAKLGSKLIMPLVTTPIGWAILAGLAIGGLVYYFWDEIKAGLEKALGMMTAAIDKVKNMFAGLDIMSGLKALVPGWILDMIGPSKAEAAEDNEKEEKIRNMRETQTKGERKKNLAAAEKAGFLDQKYGRENSIDRDKITAGINNGSVTQGMLQAIIEDKDLSKEDTEWIKIVLGNDKFAQTKSDKAIKVTHGTTGDEPTDGPKQISAPPLSDFKTDKLNAAMERSSTRALDLYREKGSKRGGKRKMEMELMSSSGELTWNKLTDKEKKRFKLQGDKMEFTAAQSPDDKMNVMNDLNTKNQTLQQGQSGSSTTVINTNASSSTSHGGDLHMSNPRQAHSNKPAVVTSLR